MLHSLVGASICDLGDELLAERVLIPAIGGDDPALAKETPLLDQEAGEVEPEVDRERHHDQGRKEAILPTL